MKLLVSLLLVTLAICCYQAEAVVCPAFIKESTLFLFSPESLLRLSLAKYNAPQEAVDAKVEVKKCTDEMPFTDRTIIAKILTKVTVKCGL
ncbi:secretoglobin family 1D member 2-like [Ochotona princeps]|uniref:secretoglobin family 1D member 2-like n=1 Tax=Ochotona princeps TaxID=9978 RepID=UPI00032B15B1|nr:secretoglobin family 1D member 2-like [Ochotona princeps]